MAVPRKLLFFFSEIKTAKLPSVFHRIWIYLHFRKFLLESHRDGRF